MAYSAVAGDEEAGYLRNQQAMRGDANGATVFGASAGDAGSAASAGAKDWEFGAPLDQVDDVIRRGFVRKVFGTLAVQLAVTFGIVALFALEPSVNSYVDMRKPDGHTWPFITAMLVSFACLVTLGCCSSTARTHPNNLVFLSVFTLAEGVLLGVLCAGFQVEAILMAVGITALVVAGLVAFAATTKHDFTGAGPYLFMMLWTLILYGVMLSFFPPLRTLQLGYSAIGVVLFSFYIVYDVQLVVGGRHNRYRFGVDDAVFAALTIYLDVINLFIRILELVNRDR